MSRSYLETLIGFLVLAIAIAFSIYAYKGAELDKNTVTGYTLNVNFDRMDGLNLGGDVRVSGIKVGTIIEATLDTYTYQAKVKLNIDNSVKLPDDSSAEIISAGLLGDKYIAIVPGGSETYFKDNDKIKFSQSSISLEALIGKFMFGGAGDKQEEEKKSPF
jgi:phospholipid/cholesterol/gamma-HCH transport system substrate-binding protein